MISCVVACAKDYCIGKDCWMPWNLPEDLKHFRRKTLHKKLVMGRKTFEALPQPLKNRTTYVLTRQIKEYNAENVEVIHDLSAFLKKMKEEKEDVVICGGATVYEQALPFIEEFWISWVDGEYEGDTYFPTLNFNDLLLVSLQQKDGFIIAHYRKK